jgi:hypothetical protein
MTDDISEEYRAMLIQLNQENYPEREPGEFTIDEFATENKISYRVAENRLRSLHNEGILEKPPRRIVRGKLRAVYKITPTVSDIPSSQ